MQKDQTTFPVEVLGRAIPYHGRTVRATLIYDISERREAEDALRESEMRYRLVARATNDAIWDWNLVTDEVRWNEGVKTLFGYTADEVGSLATWWYEHIHPEEEQRVVSGIHALIDSGEEIWSDEYRYRRADGSYALVIDRGFIVHDDTGRAIRMIGSMTDITERKRAEAALQQSEELYRLITENTIDLISVLDQQMRTVYASPSFRQVLGYDPAELIGTSAIDQAPSR